VFNQVQLKKNLFYALAACVTLFALSFSFTSLFIVAQICLGLTFLITLFDYWRLSRILDAITADRKVKSKLSLGDFQNITYSIANDTNMDIDLELIDEFPFQLQFRDAVGAFRLKKNTSLNKEWSFRPILRGVYEFGDLICFISNPKISFLSVKKKIEHAFTSAVYPSIIQMKKYELQVFSKTASLSGIRKVRTIGENDEFDFIRAYHQGDNIKSINWKATSRKHQLMINQFQNSRSQNVYCFIDKGRSMKMPFDDLSLLDYSINAALVLSNIVLKKYDKMGLVSFSNKIGQVLQASSLHNQIERISKTLFNQKTDFKESSFELLFFTIRKMISRRSVIFLFTNFENKTDLERNLPYLKAIAKKHLLVTIFFENTQLKESGEMSIDTISDIYLKTFAQHALYEKEQIRNTLNRHGIIAILSKPEQLSINVINKYLEIKAKRMK